MALNKAQAVRKLYADLGIEIIKRSAGQNRDLSPQHNFPVLPLTPTELADWVSDAAHKAATLVLEDNMTTIINWRWR